MPSSKDRRRIEVPVYIYDQLAQIAKTEDRAITSVAWELLSKGLFSYQPLWIPGKHLERFNDRAKQALAFAQEEARSFFHNYIGTEHLLLGLLRERDSLAAQALAKLGVTIEQVRAGIEQKIGRGDEPVQGEIDYVPRVRKVLSLAMAEAERQGSGYVRTEHILLGIVRDGGGVGADILDTLGVLGKVRAQVFALLGVGTD
jgi:ATP-dependent Clp protease ATP-binding subunit ClpA